MKQKNKTAVAVAATATARICNNASKKYDMNQMTAFVKMKRNTNRIYIL